MARAVETGRRLALIVSYMVATVACTPGHPPPVARASAPRDTARVVAVGVAGTTSYALTAGGGLWAWDRATGAVRALARDHVAALATDGSVALSLGTSLGGVTVEAWEPGSGKRLASERWGDGLWDVMGVGRGAAVLDTRLAPPVGRSPSAGVPQMPAPIAEIVVWDIAARKVDSLRTRTCEHAALSADGSRFVCGLTWHDRATGVVAWPPPLAEDWEPPASPDGEGPHDGSEVARCAKCMPLSPTFLESIWMSPDGGSVYLTISNVEDPPRWRLSRWSPDPTGKTAGALERLSDGADRIAPSVLAASGDGRTIVTGGDRMPPAVRRAPQFEVARLESPPADAAAFTDDDARLVTGHRDGTLRLWEASTGRALMTASPPRR